MGRFELKNDLQLMGYEVPTFPEGIGEAFNKLAETIPNGYQRSYYGISFCRKDGSIVYQTAAEVQAGDESSGLNLQVFTIPKGTYNAVSLRHWRKNLHKIKEIFMEILGDTLPDENHPCVEWYHSDDEMLCMVKTSGKQSQ